MPRVLITTDGGRVMHDERIQADDFTTEHFRRCLAERLWWATEEAERAPAPRGHGGRVRGGATTLRPHAPIAQMDRATPS